MNLPHLNLLQLTKWSLTVRYGGLAKTLTTTFYALVCASILCCQLQPVVFVTILNSLYTYHTHTHTPGDRYDPEPRSRSQHRHADKSKEESFYDEDPRGPIGRRDNGDVSGRAYKDRDVTSRPYRDASPEEEEEEEEEEKNEEKQQ